MISTRTLSSTFIILAILSWLALAFSALFVLFGHANMLQADVGDELPKFFFIAFLTFLYLYFRYAVAKAESINFIDLLWRVFITGLITSIVLFAVLTVFYLLSESKFLQNVLAVNFFYLINVGIVSVFLLSTFTVWKRLILYQKSRRLLVYWKVFEYSIMASLAFTFIEYQIFDVFFNVILLLLILTGLALSFNLKWIAYLNFKQKLRSVLLLALLIMYLWFFVTNLLNFSNEFQLQLNMLSNVTVLALVAFIFIYAIIALLVILFNLPTSSVFEQKMSEVINFQRLSQSIQQGYTEDKVYEILLESTVNAVFASAAWLEIYDEKGQVITMLYEKLNQGKVDLLKDEIENTKLRRYIKNNELLDINPHKLAAALKDPDYRSVVVMPLIVKEKIVGRLVLFKDVSDGFNKEMVDIINSFVNQACISLENLRLLNEAIATERYREELKIASEVHKNLLPALDSGFKGFELSAFSNSADEVGGDYYDVFKLDDHKTAIIIGDVSGKGTSAAFQMAQMKGVFHSLAQLGLPPKEFFVYANNALSRCLNSKTFITASYYIIDTTAKKICYARAGHCPTIMYSNDEKRAHFLKIEGMGLGILRDNTYINFIDQSELSYQSNDVLMLYTDGITEARSEQGREYGYRKLATVLQQNAHLPAYAINEEIVKDLHHFVNHEDVKDDYTAVVVKFA